MNNFTIEVAKGVPSRIPATHLFDRAERDGGRQIGYYQYGVDTQSAAALRDNKLIPAIDSHEHVTVDLSDYNYYGSSFLEEVFGGLVRHYGPGVLREKLDVVHRQLPSIVTEAWYYMSEDMADS